MYSCSQIGLIFMGHRSKICGQQCDVIWATGTPLPKRKASKDFILQFRIFSNFLLVPLFKCSFSWFYLSSNTVFRGFICLQMQFFVVLSVFKCSFSWFYLSSNAVFVVLSVFKLSFSCFYLCSNSVFHAYISSNVVSNASICLQIQLLMLVSVFKFSFIFWRLSSNAVLNAGISLKTQFSMLVSVFKCRFSFFYLSSRVVLFRLVFALTKNPLTSPHLLYLKLRLTTAT
jgi:hypothetical protein